MTDDDVVQWLNANWPPSVQTLNGEATSFDQASETLCVSFEAHSGFCHSGDIVQGGYITGMLDAAMAYAAIGLPGLCEGVATLEIKVNFVTPGNSGAMQGVGRIVHRGRTIGYLSGELYQGERLVATATSTVKLLQPRAGR